MVGLIELSHKIQTQKTSHSTQSDTLNAVSTALFSAFFQKIDELYVVLFKKNPTFFQRQPQEKSFMDCFNRVFNLLNIQAYQELHKTFPKELEAYRTSAFKYLKGTASLQPINYHLFLTCQRYKTFFVQMIQQNNDPNCDRFGFQCGGISLKWALELFQNPPQKPAQPTEICKKHQEFLTKILTEQRFPPQSQTVGSMGHSRLTPETLLYQKYIFVLLQLPERAPRYFFKKNLKTLSEGKLIAREMLKEFESLNLGKNPKVSILGLVLLAENRLDVEHKPIDHMLCVAKIQLKAQTVYRIIDPSFGEFECRGSQKDLIDWFDKYFQKNGYTKDFGGFNLYPLDSILPYLPTLVKTLEQQETSFPSSKDRGESLFESAKTTLAKLKKEAMAGQQLKKMATAAAVSTAKPTATAPANSSLTSAAAAGKPFPAIAPTGKSTFHFAGPLRPKSSPPAAASTAEVQNAGVQSTRSAPPKPRTRIPTSF